MESPTSFVSIERHAATGTNDRTRCTPGAVGQALSLADGSGRVRGGSGRYVPRAGWEALPNSRATEGGIGAVRHRGIRRSTRRGSGTKVRCEDDDQRCRGMTPNTSAWSMAHPRSFSCPTVHFANAPSSTASWSRCAEHRHYDDDPVDRPPPVGVRGTASDERDTREDRDRRDRRRSWRRVSAVSSAPRSPPCTGPHGSTFVRSCRGAPAACPSTRPLVDLIEDGGERCAASPGPRRRPLG